jgi:hypothetical protein
MRKVIMKPFCARLAPEVYVLANFQNVQLLCGQEAPLMFVNCFRFSKMLPENFVFADDDMCLMLCLFVVIV